MLVAYLKTEVSQGCLKAGADYPVPSLCCPPDKGGGWRRGRELLEDAAEEECQDHDHPCRIPRPRIPVKSMQNILHKLRKTIEKLYVKKLQKHFFKIRMKMLYLQLHTGTISLHFIC